MKRMVFGVCVAVLVFSVALQAQTSGSQPSPEHKKLEVWAGNWTFQGEAKDSPSGPSYKIDCSWQGRWLPGGFFLEIHGTWKGQSGEDHYLEILGYDPVKKTYFGYVFFESGSLEIYTSTFNDRSCLESGTDYSRDGEAIKWRHAWNFSPDWMAVSGKCEVEADGKWWTSFEAKGVKRLIK
jgi:hypothetical protein